MTSSGELTPQQRLAASRQLIVRHMSHGKTSQAARVQHDHREIGSSNPAIEYASSKWELIKRTVRIWWHHHPAHLAIDLAKPAVGKYARARPVQLLGLSAAIGAAFILVRPWRLVSVTGLLLATLKSSKFPGLLLSLISNSPRSKFNSKEPS